MNNPAQDGEAVAAVRGGDVERYRDLVERHERRVFAVAWSRLGDAALAEEATQEAFIRGYRHIGFLSQGGKFGPWISSIARRVAINLGFRHRRELNKRKRWAVEQIASGGEPSEADEVFTPETLRQTLAELPAPHRECLVLYYLEGRCGTETAAALGISETAFRVRLHRARAALREQLEEKLAGSLEKLRPAKTVVPAVMASVLVASSAKAATGGAVAGTGAKIGSLLGKTFVFSWLLQSIPFVLTLPYTAYIWLLGFLERRNYRESGGFRAQLHRNYFRSVLWGFPLFILATLLLNQVGFALFGDKAMLFAFIGFGAAMSLVLVRFLTIYRDPASIGIVVCGAVMPANMFAFAVGWIQFGLFVLLLTAVNFTIIVLTAVSRKERSTMDHNLFLRAARGPLELPANGNERADTSPFDRKTLLRFARFLTSRRIIVNFRWETEGLALRMYPVKYTAASIFAMIFAPLPRGCSYICLRSDGSVAAHCGKKDETDLAAIFPGEFGRPEEMEQLVAASVTYAWRDFRAGNTVAAERALGKLPEKEIFVASLPRTAALRLLRLLPLVVAAATTFLAARIWWSDWVRGGSVLAPVAVSEAEVRATLAQAASRTNRPGLPPRFVPYLDDTIDHEILPPTNLLTPAALQTIRVNFENSFPRSSSATPLQRLHRLLRSSALENAFLNGWLPADYFGLERGIARQAGAGADPQTRKSWSHLPEFNFEGFTSLGTGGYARDVRSLRKLDCLDLLDATNTVETLLRHQLLSSSIPPGHRTNVDHALLHGMFDTSDFNPIKETWESLVILEAFGAVNRVDRDACVKGILRFHHGRGLFGSVREGDGFVILGDTQDTLHAFESLRILNALDRVKDLEKWKFRPYSTTVAAGRGAVRMITWDEIEAWVCQQRLERALRGHRENPRAPVQSLLEP